jgi:hypothetical protein
MTLKEVALLLGYSEQTLKDQFPKTQENLKKKGILLMKWGRGKDATYEVEYPALDELELMEDED